MMYFKNISCSIECCMRLFNSISCSNGYCEAIFDNISCWKEYFREMVLVKFCKVLEKWLGGTPDMESC
jgi:hypothetical protein